MLSEAAGTFPGFLRRWIEHDDKHDCELRWLRKVSDLLVLYLFIMLPV
jgi:hypothetical protein